MKIVRIDVGEVFIPLAKPFKTALRTVENVEDIVVRITADSGEVGYGEAPPTAVITGDTKGSIRCAIEDFIRPALLGMEIEDLDGIMHRLHTCIVKNTSAKAAVDMAVYDLYAQRFGAPLFRLLGGFRDTVETDITISVNPVPQMIEDSLEAVRQGYRILKIKVGKEGLADVARIAGIREAVGGGIRLRVDANQGWTAKQAVRIITAMEDKGLQIDLVEQPVPAHDLEGMRRERILPRGRGRDHPYARGGSHQYQADENGRHLAGAEDLRAGRDVRRRMHDRLYAGIQAGRERGGASGRGETHHHARRSGRPVPVPDRSLYGRPRLRKRHHPHDGCARHRHRRRSGGFCRIRAACRRKTAKISRGFPKIQAGKRCRLCINASMKRKCPP